MIKIEKVSYKALKRVSVMDRLKLANDPGIGNTLMSALTPTQMAELFPSYYRQGLPDVSGFQKAIPSAMTQAKQQWYEEQVQGAVKGDKAGAVLQPTLKKNESTWEKVKRKASEAMGIPSGKGKPLPPAQLTATQRAAIEDLKKGAIAVDDPRVKFMAGLTNEQLSKTGIQRIKGDGGKEVFNYTPPVISAASAKESLQRGNISSEGIDWSKGSSTGSPDNKRRGAIIMKYAKEFGANDAAAAAIAGNLNQESAGFKSNIQNSRGEDSYGLFQLNGPRKYGLLNWAAKNGRDPGDPRTQVEYALKHEPESLSGFKRSSGISMQEFLQTRQAPGDASRIWLQGWERPTDHATGGQNDRVRAKWSDMYYEHYQQRSPDSVTRDFTDTQIAAEQKRLQQEQEMGRLGSLAEFTTATPQQLTRDPHIKNATDSGSTDFSSLAEQATKIGQISHPDFAVRNNGLGSKCGVGTHSFAGAMFGDKYFNNALGGDAHSLSTGNSYFQKSGYYSNPIPPNGDLTDKAYLDSLPVGTVISAEGGGRGLGHVQIKVGPGQWASDGAQGNKVLMQSRGVAYYNHKVHLPNERGQQSLAERGYPINSPTASTQAAVTNPTPPGAAPDSQSLQGASTPQPQVLTRDPHIISPQGEPAPAAPTASPVTEKAKTQSSSAIKPSGTKFIFNKDDYLNEIARKHPMIDSAMASMVGQDRAYAWRETVKGLKEAETKGVLKYNEKTGEMTVHDMNHPDVQKILKDMKDNDLDRNTFMKKVEEEKKAKETKPGEVKPVAAPQASNAPPQAPTASVSAAPAKPSSEIQQHTEGRGESASGGKSAFDVDRAMALIRRQESGSFGGNYSADAALKTKGKMTASGAYQFNNKTWGAVTKQFNIGTEYKRAVDAPKDVQDAVMRARVEDLYKKHGSLEKVLMTHFTGNAAGKMSAKAIKANGGLTGPQYVASIIKEHGPAYDKTLNPDVKPTQTVSTPGSADVQAPVEKASYTPSQQGPSVSPQAKTSTGPVGPAISPEMGGVRKDIHALRDEMNNKFGEIQQSSQIQPSHFKRTISDNNANMMNELKTATAKEYSNPTAERALGSRPHFAETGGATAHYSGGNNVG